VGNSQVLLAERLNAEPPIFRGCSATELGLIVGIAIAIWLPISLLIAWLLGAVTMGLGLAGVAIVGTVILMGTVFQRIKRGRPEGYYQQKLLIDLARLHLRSAPFIRCDGHWAIGREHWVERQTDVSLSL